MGNKKGRTAYPENFKTLVIEAHQSGESYESIARRFKISAYSAKSWCGSRPEVNRRKIAPLKRGRPTSKPEDLEKRIRDIVNKSTKNKNIDFLLALLTLPCYNVQAV